MREQAGDLVANTMAWFSTAGRDLPWRHPDRTPWGVMVSEFMLQQTQVDRVLPVWQAWIARWPTATELASADLATVLRAWGRLGYPRRAQRLHAAAAVITERHAGQVPGRDEQLRALPGVGEYTSAAIRAFAFGQPAVVLDTNVRRVLARTLQGSGTASAQVTNAERARAAELVQQAGAHAPHWSAAVMELGALVCTARNPDCAQCPVRSQCTWYQAGQPASVIPRRQQPRFDGSDRQVRGLIMARLREGPVEVAAMDLIWSIVDQRERAVNSLLADGLVVRTANAYQLPETRALS